MKLYIEIRIVSVQTIRFQDFSKILKDIIILLPWNQFLLKIYYQIQNFILNSNHCDLIAALHY